MERSMILAPPEIRAVAAGRKTQHRLVVRRRHGARVACPVRAGESCVIGGELDINVAVLDVRRELLGAATDADARAEGYVSVGGRRPLALWREGWVRRHDGAWLRRELVDRAAVYGDEVVPWILAERFERRWAGVDVYVVTFRLDEARPHYLARATRSSGDYTISPSRAIDTELRQVRGRDGLLRTVAVAVPVADPEYVERKLREDRAALAAQEASFRRDLDAERFERARRAAEAAGIQTEGATRLVRRAAQALERAVGNAGGDKEREAA